MTTPPVKITKFIKDSDESACSHGVEHLALWRGQNNLQLNALETVEMTEDLRRSPILLSTLTLINSTVVCCGNLQISGIHNLPASEVGSQHRQNYQLEAQQRMNKCQLISASSGSSALLQEEGCHNTGIYNNTQYLMHRHHLADFIPILLQILKLKYIILWTTTQYVTFKSFEHCRRRRRPLWKITNELWTKCGVSYTKIKKQ